MNEHEDEREAPYCMNSLCQWEAVENVGTDEEPLWLCAQCLESFHRGQRAASLELLTACEAFHFIPDCGGDWCDIATAPDDGLLGTCRHDKLCRWAYANEQRFKAAIATAKGGRI